MKQAARSISVIRQVGGARLDGFAACAPSRGEGAVGFLGVLNYAPTIDTPVNKAFQKAYKEKYGHASSEFGAQA